MTIEDLQKRYPQATTSTWHQHSNGGGWVENTAKVDATAYVGPDAVVQGFARVLGNAVVQGTAVVRGNALVGDNAIVSGNALVQGNAWVDSDSIIADSSEVTTKYIPVNKLLFSQAQEQPDGSLLVPYEGWFLPQTMKLVAERVTGKSCEIKDAGNMVVEVILI